ncbi:MAG: hypothetical protein N3G80_00690 [Candidatus Micrarchaeota archaeon]|nr:hypothetical protein [Candidatus Micrarchaeota archaeon]
MQLPNIYRGNYKLLALVPIVLVLISLFYIPQIKKGVDFKGGTLVTMQTKEGVDIEKLKEALEQKGYAISSAKSLKNPAGYKVEVEVERDEKLTQAEELKSAFFEKIERVAQLEADVGITNQSAEALEKYMQERKELDKKADALFEIAGLEKNASGYANANELKKAVSAAYRMILDSYSSKLAATLSQLVAYESAQFNEVSASLSAKFLEKAVNVVIYSTIFVSIVVFLIFRTAIPSAAVLIGALCDVLIAMGAMGFFGIPLTLASFAALLMLIGFSLDTDVLLTMRVIKRHEGTPRERAYEAMKTGTTMSAALMLSFLCLFALASITHINTYFEISAVALAGLVGDLIATWMLNAVIVIAYLEGGGSRGEEKKPLSALLFSDQG